MTNLTFNDIKDVNSNKEKLFSVKQDYSSIDKNNFLKVLENANNANSVAYDNSENSWSNGPKFTETKTFTPENSVTKAYLNASTESEHKYKRNETENINKFSNNNQNNVFINVNKQEYVAENITNKKEETTKYRSKQDIDDSQISKSKVKQPSDNKSEKQVLVQKEELKETNTEEVKTLKPKDKKISEQPKEKLKETNTEEVKTLKLKDKKVLEQPKEELEETNAEEVKTLKLKDKKISEQPKEEIKSDIEKDLLQTRIQLATSVNINITGNKTNDPVNKSEDKLNQNNSKESLSVKVNINQAHEKATITQQTDQDSKLKVNINQAHEKVTITQQTDQDSKLKVKIDYFQQPENSASPKTDIKLPSDKPLKEPTIGEKKDKTDFQIQEKPKLNDKSVDIDTSKNQKKIEVMIQNNHPELAAGLKQEETPVPSSSHKNLGEILSKNDMTKPLVTKLEIQNNANETSSGQKHKQNLTEEQTAKLTSQLIQSGDTNISTISAEKAIVFDKILESSQDVKANASSILDQISQKTSGEIKSGKSEITLSLRPESLGKVDINIISEKGFITAQITTENSQVKEILSKELDALKQKLQDQGVNLDKVVIKVQEPAQTNSNHSNFDQDSQKYNQTDQNASNTSDFNSSRHAQEQKDQNYVNYATADLNAETDLNTNTSEISSEIHQGMIDYRI